LTLSNQNHNICAVIPFYNEERFIETIVEKASPFVDRLVLVNDGSTDNSVLQIPLNENITLLSIEINMGKGFALNLGIKEAVKLKADIIVTLDADLQHDPSMIPEVIKGIQNGEFDIVVASRFNKRGMPIQRKISNYLTSKILSWKTGIKIPDSQSGYRAYNAKIIMNILPESFGFESESEILVNAAREKLKLGFVDIPTIYGNESSKIKALNAIIGFIKIILTKKC